MVVYMTIIVNFSVMESRLYSMFLVPIVKLIDAKYFGYLIAVNPSKYAVNQTLKKTP
jgi:hypothetical protein